MENKIQPPPRLLLGASLLFWGAMTSHPLMGLIAALLVEGANWIRFRWDFKSTACSRAWRFCMVLIIIAGTLIWLDGYRYTALPKLMVWLPVLLLPLMFVQAYGLRDWMPLNSFSFFTKLHRDRNIRQGLEATVFRFNFGNPYFIIAMVAASLGPNSDKIIFLPCLMVLGGWLVFSRVKIRPLALLALILIAGFMGLSGQIGMQKLYTWATNRALADGPASTSPTVSKTSIGSLGEIKQSTEMLWRLTPLNNRPPPHLLRLASYNRYKGINWRNTLPDPLPQDDDNFRPIAIEITDGEPHYFLREKMTPADLRKPLPIFKLRGASSNEAPIPLPGDAASLQEFELDAIEINPLGSVRVFPKKAIIDGTVRWGDISGTEAKPWPVEDLFIDAIEKPAIEEVAASLDLVDMPTTQAKLARLKQWFSHEFEYTRYLDIEQAYAMRPSAIKIFLTTSRKGHCEYFATAATLLLRAAGTPARYCVGYVVAEKDTRHNEYIIRGTHAHAWVRAWDESKGAWVDFDPTPPGWLGAEISNHGKSPWLADAYQRFKEDFFLWRNRPKNRIAATIVMWLIGLSVLTFVGRRLWKSKLIVEEKKRAIYTDTPPPRTPLHDLESRARKILGPRPPGITYANWLAGLPLGAIQREELSEALSIHQQLRFDPSPTPEAQFIYLSEIATKLAARLRHIPHKKS